MLTKAEKLEQSERLREALSDVTTLFLLHNHGLNVNQVNELRSQIRKSEASYKVVKNTVVKLAVEGTEMAVLADHLTGPNALAFTHGDGVELAKVLRDFVKTHPALVFRQAYLEGQLLEAEEAQKIADLPSRDELVARLLYILQSPIRRLAVAINAPLTRLATVLRQIAEQEQARES